MREKTKKKKETESFIWYNTESVIHSFSQSVIKRSGGMGVKTRIYFFFCSKKNRYRILECSSNNMVVVVANSSSSSITGMKKRYEFGFGQQTKKNCSKFLILFFD